MDVRGASGRRIRVNHKCLIHFYIPIYETDTIYQSHFIIKFTSPVALQNIVFQQIGWSTLKFYEYENFFSYVDLGVVLFESYSIADIFVNIHFYFICGWIFVLKKLYTFIIIYFLNLSTPPSLRIQCYYQICWHNRKQDKKKYLIFGMYWAKTSSFDWKTV